MSNETVTPRPIHRCPICHDDQPFVLWLESEPPPTCPDDPAWPRKSMTSICCHQMRKARQAAERRRLVPDAFDENGNILPGQIARVLRAVTEAHAHRTPPFVITLPSGATREIVLEPEGDGNG